MHKHNLASILVGTIGLASGFMVGCSTIAEPTPGASGEPRQEWSAAEADTTTEVATNAEVEPTEDEAIASVSSDSSDTPDIVFYAEDSIAIQGADPVAYFTQGAYVPGSAEYEYEWGNAIWRFASAEHRDLFAANPEEYAPQYGGFCAWAISQGYTAPIDPEAWSIVDDKLYLNYDRGVQARWERDIPGHIASADANWGGLLAELLGE
jgi:hypothetical protein